MTLKPETEEEVKRNSRFLTSCFRIGQTALAALIVWLVSITYNEVKGSVQNQIAMQGQLSSIQSDVNSLKQQSQRDHDELVALRTRVQMQSENHVN